MPLKLAAVFAWLLSAGRHSFRRAQSLSTRLRLAKIQAEPRTGPSLHLTGIAGFSPASRNVLPEAVAGGAAVGCATTISMS